MKTPESCEAIEKKSECSERELVAKMEGEIQKKSNVGGVSAEDVKAELPVGSSTDSVTLSYGHKQITHSEGQEEEEERGVDLDSTGDSDRLVIAEEESPVKDNDTRSPIRSKTIVSEDKTVSPKDTLVSPKGTLSPESTETGNNDTSNKSPTLTKSPVDGKQEHTEGKARRRRKPTKVLKHEASPPHIDSYNEKLDQNFNSLEVEAKPKPPQSNGGGPPETIVNSFVAQAMKLWYDEELPKSLASPSKELGKFVTEAKQRGIPVPKDLASQLNTSEAGESSKNKENIDTPTTTLGSGEQMSKRVEDNVKGSRSCPGVAPDDLYYSTPSPTVPVHEYWREKSVPSPTALTGPPPPLPPPPAQSPAVAGGVPMLAKAMHTLRVPSPAHSPSLGSDQESPVANGQKLYFCTPCNKSFTFRTNLTRHQRTFHGRPCRRRTRDCLTRDDSDRRSEHSFSSEDPDNILEKRDFVEEKVVPKALECVNELESNYGGRFSPSVVSEAKVGRYSPSMPCLGASDSTPHKNILPPYLTDSNKEQDYVVVTPKEKVSCSLCLTSFTSPSQLAKHEPTCRGINRSNAYSDCSGAIDLSKPKISKTQQQPQQQQPQQNQVTSDVSNKSYKPKFHYTMADMLGGGGMDPALVSPFLPHTAAAIHSMTAAAFMSQHQAATTAFLPTSLEQAFPNVPGVTGAPGVSLPAHLTDASSSGRKPYKCSFCTKKYSSYKSLVKHTSYVHKMSLVQPPNMHPERITHDPTTMNAMVAMAAAEMKMLSEEQEGALNLSSGGGVAGESGTRFPCKMCGQIFSLGSHLRVHIQTKHLGAGSDTSNSDLAKTNSGKPSEWVCQLCSQNFASKRNLYRHLSHVHKADPKKDSQSVSDGGNSEFSPANSPSLATMVPQSGRLTPGCYPRPSSASPQLSMYMPMDRSGNEEELRGTNVVHHLQEVVDRVLSEEHVDRKSPVTIKREAAPSPTPSNTSSSVSLHSSGVKLPPKKAIMEEYKQELEKKTMEEKRQTNSPAATDFSSSNPHALNLSNINKRSLSPGAALGSAVDLSANRVQSFSPSFSPYVDAKDRYVKTEKGLPNNEDRKEYYPNPFSAILNLSQTYLRKLLNETPLPAPTSLSEAYSLATSRDKENSVDKDYSRLAYGRLGGFPPDTTSKLREMLTNKALSKGEAGGRESRDSSRPSSGCPSPVDMLYESSRKPLMVSSENQPEYTGLADISPLRMNSSNMMALKHKLMDAGGDPSEWKLSAPNRGLKKRKNIDSVDGRETYFGDEVEPVKKKFKEDKNKGRGFDVPDGGENGSFSSSVDNIKTGEFPAIAIGKRHICGLCGASFTFQTNLTRHQRKLHGKPFVRKSSMGQKVEGLLNNEESAPLTMVPPVSSPASPALGLKQEMQ